MVEGSRIGVYAALGATAGAVPLPWIPEMMIRRVRGALAHDIAAHHGLSLTKEARTILADPASPDSPRGTWSRAIRYVGFRIAARAVSGLGPLAMVWPVRRALETYALGVLFDRYLSGAREERVVRVDEQEARRVRAAIDAAFRRALTVEVAPVDEPAPAADERDRATALVDSLLGLTAGVPSRVVRRLEAAFDEVLANGRG